MAKQTTQNVTRKMIGLPDSVWREVEDYRAELAMASSNEAVRRLVQAGLAARAVASKRRDERGESA